MVVYKDWVLLAFEALTGIKINLSKTEMIPMNLDSVEVTRLAATIGCKLSTFPLKYLGVPLSDNKLKLANWQGIIDKVQNKTQSWKDSLLSIGGRLTLLDSVLSATPLYMLSLYKLPVKVKKK
jgi:hypothetical protein